MSHSCWVPPGRESLQVDRRVVVLRRSSPVVVGRRQGRSMRTKVLVVAKDLRGQVRPDGADLHAHSNTLSAGLP